MKILWTSLSLSIVLSAATQVAAQPSEDLRSASSCRRTVSGAVKGDGFILVPSGADKDTFPRLIKVAETLYGPKGLFEGKLGLDIGPQVLEFVRGTTMNCLTAHHAHAAPHPHDGAKVHQALSQPNPVLEYVAPSANWIRSFYQDMTTFEDQVYIMIHIAGHAHVMRNSRYSQQYGVDIMAESLEFSRFMGSLYDRFDPQRIDSFYQQLLTIAHGQDYVVGKSNKVEDFVPERENISFRDESAQTGPRRHPQRPTANLLQFFVANLPPSTPPELVELARRFERIHRFGPGIVRTKFIHEGLSTILEELVTEFVPEFTDLRFALPYASLIRNVAYPQMTNPYWLGREALRRLREKFYARPEIAPLPRLEKARLFLREFTDKVVKVMDDWDFLKLALDDTWINRKGFYLTRPVGNDPYDPAQLGPQQSPEDQAPWVVVATDPTRVIDRIIRNTVDHRFHMPRVLVVNSEGTESGAIELAVQDDVGSKIPLHLPSMVWTMIVHAQFSKRPISLSTLVMNQKPADWSAWREQAMLAIQQGVRPKPFNGEPITEFVRIRVQVTPSGKVQVAIVDEKSGTETLAPELAAQLQKVADAYVSENDFWNAIVVPPLDTTLQASTATQIVQSLGDSLPTSLYHQAPTAPGALAALGRKLESRMTMLLQQMMHGKRDMIRGANGVKLRALPQIPQFRFDEDAKKFLRGQGEDVPVSGLEVSNIVLAKAPFSPDDGLIPAGGRGRRPRPGDVFWGPDPREAYGDGEGEEGESQPGDENGPKPGTEGLDPSFIDIPLDLYAKLLDENIELPRLRPKTGASVAKKYRKGGEINRKYGDPQSQTILRRAFNLGVADRVAKEGPEAALTDPQALVGNPLELLRNGLALMRPDEWAVKSFKPKKQPNYNAVVIINMDFSGSMDTVLPTAKKIVYDLRALLKKKYPKVEFRFVAFDSQPHVYDDAKTFFNLRLGGGTSYRDGFVKTLEVLGKFPRAKWDRYVISLGDLIDVLSPELKDAVGKVYDEAEFSGVMRISSYNQMNSEMGQFFEAMGQNHPWFGYVDLNDGEAYAPSAFRQLFKNDEPR